MATATAFAYNTGSPIPGTTQVGSLAVGIPTNGFGSTGLEHWGGPDQELGIVVAKPIPNNTQPTPVVNYLSLDNTHRGTDVNLSGSPLQTAHQQFGYQQSVLGETLIGTTDKIMFSVLVSLSQPGTLANSHVIGIGKTAMNYQGNPYGGYPGNDGQSTGYGSNGTIYNNGTPYYELPSWGNGDIIDICINNNISGMWVRKNGGYWNDDINAHPETGANAIEIIGGPFYPVLCPGYEGTMTIQNNAAYGIPNNFRFLGVETASVAFSRTSNNSGTKEAEFIRLAYDLLYGPGDIGENTPFANGTAASTALTAAGYWNSWTSFGSSGFQWMTINSVTSTTASGIGQNSITIAITQDSGGMASHSGMYNPTTFPEEYGVPISGTQIQNNNSGVFTAIFSQPVLNPLVAFASVGQPGLQVPVISTLPFTPIFSQATTYQSPSGPTQYTQFTGEEGFNIIRIDGTVSSVSFTYTVSEVYCTVCFGFVDQNA